MICEPVKGYDRMSGEAVAGLNQRIKEKMKGAVREYQKKQRTCLISGKSTQDFYGIYNRSAGTSCFGTPGPL